MSKCTAIDTGCWEGSRHWAHFLSFSLCVGHQVLSSSALTPAQELPNHHYFASLFECSFSCLRVMFWVYTATFWQWERSQTLSIPEPLVCSCFFLCSLRLRLCGAEAQAEGVQQGLRQHMCLPLPPWAHTCTPCSSLVQGRQCGSKGSTPYVCSGSQTILGKL